MKNNIIKYIKTKRFLYSLLTSIILYGFALISSRFWVWLIPWRGLEILVWFIVYFTLLYYVILHWDYWFNKIFKK